MGRILDNVSGIAPDVFNVAVADGQVPNWQVFRKFGICSAVPTSTTHEMWDGADDVRTLPTTAAVAAVSSTSADDTSAGTGAQTVTVMGLDENYLEVSETVSMNGLTPVNTTQTFIRVNSAYVATAGSGGTNAGEIDVDVGGDEQQHIAVGIGEAAGTGYCVPANKKLIVTLYTAGVGRLGGSADCSVKGEIRLFGTGSWRAISNIYLYTQIHSNGWGATALPPKTDIRQTIYSSGTTQAYGIVAGYLIKVA